MSKNPNIPVVGSLARTRAEADKKTKEIAVILEAERAAEQVLEESYKRLFSGEMGRSVLNDLISRFELTGRVFTLNGSGTVDESRAQIRDGERAAVNYILTRAGMKLVLQPTQDNGH